MKVRANWRFRIGRLVYEKGGVKKKGWVLKIGRKLCFASWIGVGSNGGFSKKK